MIGERRYLRMIITLISFKFLLERRLGFLSELDQSESISSLRSSIYFMLLLFYCDCLSLDPLIFHPLKTNNISSDWSAHTADWIPQT